jgi:Fe-S-cluster containining protein
MTHRPADPAPGGHGSPANASLALQPGVFHACRRCTNCCRWPGDVRLEDGEIPRIARFLGLAEDAFIERFTRLRTNRHGLSLIEKNNHECIMLDGNACRIHPVKPAQCAGFPNTWNFPGWEDVCEAEPVAIAMSPPSPPAAEKSGP